MGSMTRNLDLALLGSVGTCAIYKAMFMCRPVSVYRVHSNPQTYHYGTRQRLYDKKGIQKETLPGIDTDLMPCPLVSRLVVQKRSKSA
jgi:hypothetical protein